MNITISKLKFGLKGREGIKSFECDVCLEGKKVATAHEYGNGGPLNIIRATESNTLVDEMSSWLLANKKIDIETHIINLVCDVETQKIITKECKKNIVYTVGNNINSLNMRGWKIPIEQVLANPKGLESAKGLIAGSIVPYIISLAPHTRNKIMRGLSEIAAKNLTLANQIQERGGFLLDTMIPELIAIDRLMLVLVRCGNGRFLCPVQDVKHFVTIIEEHNKTVGVTLDSDYIRDISLPA